MVKSKICNNQLSPQPPRPRRGIYIRTMIEMFKQRKKKIYAEEELRFVHHSVHTLFAGCAVFLHTKKKTSHRGIPPASDSAPCYIPIPVAAHTTNQIKGRFREK